MTEKDMPRLFVTAGVFVLLGFILWHNRDNEMLIGALIGAFGTAITFWLGSSKGSADKSDQIERERADTQEVTVVNPPGDPVPTTTSGKTAGDRP